jgi:hypothetical protein
MLRLLAVLVLAVALLQLGPVHGCTTYALGRLATADGSVMSVHTSDGGGTTDPRLARIPAAEKIENVRYWLTPTM